VVTTTVSTRSRNGVVGPVATDRSPNQRIRRTRSAPRGRLLEFNHDTRHHGLPQEIMIILGLSYTGAHDSSAAIVRDGVLIAAAEESASPDASTMAGCRCTRSSTASLSRSSNERGGPDCTPGSPVSFRARFLSRRDGVALVRRQVQEGPGTGDISYTGLRRNPARHWLPTKRLDVGHSQVVAGSVARALRSSSADRLLRSPPCACGSHVPDIGPRRGGGGHLRWRRRTLQYRDLEGHAEHLRRVEAELYPNSLGHSTNR